jgi:hypothetical protein
LASLDGGASAGNFEVEIHLSDVAIHLSEGLHLNERSGLKKGGMTLVVL